MRKYTEEDLQRALFAVKNGLSQKKAQTIYGVPRSTLQNRIKGHITRQEAHEPEQRLSKVQEEGLARWILVQESVGLAPTHGQIRAFAGRILWARGDALPLGKRWMAGFLRRNPILKTKKQFRIESVRVNGATTEVIKKWWPNLTIPAIQAIKPENRWNMDEAGIMEGMGDNGLVVGSVGKRFIQKKHPGSRAWTSFIECISATGRSLHPLVIFKGKSIQQQWFETKLDDFKYWQFTATENGWTTDDTCLEWLKKVFIPQTQPQDRSEARLLVLDGHGSHETTDFMWECFLHNIYLIYLPPHTSHVLQPLDLAVFSSLKTAYRKYVGNYSLLTDSTPLGRRNFLKCYYQARLAALIARNIRSGWQASGLWPVNSAKPLMNRLLLENSNKLEEEPQKRKEKEPFLEWNADQSAFQVSTPKKLEDIRDQVHQVSQLGKALAPTARVLFRKVSKAVAQRDFQIAQQERKIQQLEARVLQLQPRKRMKVQTSPNSRFASIRAIYQAQIDAGDRDIDAEDSDGTTELSSTLSHITVRE
jgi:DDE superfamily endonuclease/Psq-like protein/Tc5 transposase-like DNA-binding protein